MKTMLDTNEQMSRVRWLDYPDRASWAAAAADKIGERLNDGIAQRNVASLIVPGGTTPQPILERLNAMELKWDRIQVGLTDERWVATSHVDSNENLVRRTLLRGPAGKAVQFHSLYTGARRPSSGLKQAEASMATMAKPFDVVLLGMGTDGHFASLFPGIPQLAAGLDPNHAAMCLAIDTPQSGFPRMSLTLSALLNAKLIILAVSGRPKRTLLSQALAGKSTTPIAALLAARKDDLEILWTD
ncbi:MAG: 6-phosphogluconolactonase [Rhodospirillaceae bacterium]|nr:6-phosphogluconolactonase [Rhodospirillaceae bacterium]